MSKYVLRRVLYMVPILFGISLVTFVLFHIAGGDPAAQAAGKYASAEQILELKKELGLDRPLHQQYFFYIKQILTLDFGRSWATQQKISSMILDGIGPSLSLTLPAFFLTILLSITIALGSSYVRGTFLDKSVMTFCLSLMSVSSLVYIVFFQYQLGYRWGWFPISGWDSSWASRWVYLALPIMIYVMLSLGGNILFFRTVFLDEMQQDYVRTARAKGLSTTVILFRHILRNSLVPIITLVVIRMPFLILGTLLLESFFGIPGIGGLIFQAIKNADFPVIKSITFIGAALYMVFQVFADIIYAYVDPKVQLR